MEPVQSKYLIYQITILITITLKYLELTNHNPSLKLTINCKAETIYSFGQKRINLTQQTIDILVIMNMINGIETSYRMVSTWLTFFYSHATDEGFELKKNCN